MRVDGVTKSRDTRGPGYEGLPIRGTAVTPPRFWQNRTELMWTPPAHRMELRRRDNRWSSQLLERFKTPCSRRRYFGHADPSGESGQDQEVLGFLKTEALPAFLAWKTSRPWMNRPGRTGNVIRTLPWSIICFPLRVPSRVRLKVPLHGPDPAAPTLTDIWPGANWYEREVFDMFGIDFKGHPNLTPPPHAA